MGVFETEERIRSLYQTNTNAAWAKNRIRILIEMLRDSKDGKTAMGAPVEAEWIADDLQKTIDGMHITS
jgi:hypothetical protein